MCGVISITMSVSPDEISFPENNCLMTGTRINHGSPCRLLFESCLIKPASRLASPSRSRRCVVTFLEVNDGALWPPTSIEAPSELFSTDISRITSP
jgi:hypothetical protein